MQGQETVDTEGQTWRKLFVFPNIAGGSGNKTLGRHQEFLHVASQTPDRKHVLSDFSEFSILFTRDVLFMLLSLHSQSSPLADRLVCNRAGVLLEGIPSFPPEKCFGVMQIF